MKKLYTFCELWEDFFDYDDIEDEPEKIELKLLINPNDEDLVNKELYKAYNNWMCEECENSILLDGKITRNMLLQVAICDYMLMWLDELCIKYKEVEQ